MHHGVWYPRWLPNSFAGLGSPTFYFYPPLPYFLAGIISLVGISSPTVLYQLVHVLSSVLAFFTMRRLLKEFSLSTQITAVASLLYTLAPYRLVDILVRDALGESFAFAWIPLYLTGIFLSLKSDSSKAQIRGVLTSAIGFTLLIFSNIPVTVMSATAGIGIALFYRQARWRNKIVLAIAPIVLGGLLSALYLLPMLYWHNTIQLDQLWHFTVNSKADLGYSLVAPFQRNEYSLSVINLYTFLVTVGMIWMTRKRESSIDRAIFWMLLGSAAVQLPWLTEPLWKTIFYFKVIQIPYRWNVVTVVFASVLIAMRGERVNCWIMYSSCALSIIFLIYCTQKLVTGSVSHQQERLREAPEYVPAFAAIPDPIAVELGKKIGSQSFADSALYQSLLHLSFDRATTVTVQQDTTVTIGTFDWPTVKLCEQHSDGMTPIPSITTTNGLMQASLSPGVHFLSLKIVRSTVEVVGEWITASAIVLISILLAIYSLYKDKGTQG